MRLKEDSTRFGFAGQIVTTDYEKLKAWAKQEPKPDQKALSAFIKYAVANLQRSTINTYISSYGLKHRVEEVSKRIKQIDPSYQYEYIGNEDFIIAMLQNGFDVKNATMRMGPNYYFNLKKFDNDDMWVEKVVKEYLNERQES